MKSELPKKIQFGCLIGMATFLIVQPIWYYLLYQILTRVEASDLMWFLYWVYVPAQLIVGTMSRMLENLFD